VRGPRFILALGALSLSAPCHAESELPLELTWSAPDGCASADDIQRELARIARVRPGRTVARVTARGSIERAGGSYRLELHTKQNGVAGERSLVAKECRSLGREVTLVLALAFGEGVELVNAEPAPAGSETTASTDGATTGGAGASSKDGASPSNHGATTSSNGTSTAASDAAPANAAAPVAATPRKPQTAQKAASPEATTTPPSPVAHGGARIAGYLGGGVRFETLPSPAGYVVVGAELGVHRFWAEPWFVWLPSVTQSLDRGVRARYDGFGGGLAGCVALPPDSWALDACIGGEALGLRGRSTGATESDDATAPVWSGLVALGVEWPARGVIGLRLDAGLHVVFNEPRFVVEGLGTTYQVPRLSPTLQATVRFGRTP